jgi:methylated-DNA-protein-cysteine methyltransferase-like protein
VTRAIANPATSYQRIYAAVRRVPKGRVATYGQIASVAGLPGRARQVGYALAALSGATALPWQRVVNAAGAISLRSSSGGTTQRILLEREGVSFDARGRIDLTRFGWRPRGVSDQASRRRSRRFQNR